MPPKIRARNSYSACSGFVEWSTWAIRNRGNEAAFASHSPRINSEIVGPISLYHTLAGVYCVRGLISIAMGNWGAALDDIVQKVVDALQLRFRDRDVQEPVVHGAAGHDEHCQPEFYEGFHRVARLSLLSIQCGTILRPFEEFPL